MIPRLTIFTPTYNRAHTIQRTYESILRQDVIFLSQVEWLIVDDGSTDNTEELVRGWQNEQLPFSLHYIKQQNGGKHTAFNRAIQEARGDFFFTVDSDDWLAEDSVKKIVRNKESITGEDSVCGIIALKCFPNGELIGRRYPDNYPLSSTRELELAGHGGERSLVFKTEIIKQYPFPVIPGERFCTECVVYDKMDANYKYFVSNDILTVCEYQSDGLTSNIISLMMHNAIGYKIYFAQRIDMATTTRERFSYAIRYWAFKLMKHDTQYNYQGTNKVSVAMCLPVGILFYLFYKMKN